MDQLIQALSKMKAKAGKILIDDPMARADQMRRDQEQRIIRDNFGGRGDLYEQALGNTPPTEDLLTKGARALYKGGKAAKARLDALRQALSD